MKRLQILGQVFGIMLAAGIFAAAFSARADDSDNRALLNRVIELEGEVKTLSAQQSAMQNGGGAITSNPNGPITNTGAALDAPSIETRLEALETQLRNMTGQIEQMSYQNQQTQMAMQKLSSDADYRMQQIEQKQAMMMQQAAANAPAAPPPSNVTNTDTNGTPPNAPPAVTAVAANTAGTIAAVNEDAPATPEELYNRAYSEMQRKEYGPAQQDFKTFLGSNPSSHLAPNAEYWLGEIYYAQGNYKLASATFADGYQKSPKGNKAPDNLLKLGLSLEQQSRTKDACTVLQQLTKDFPAAPDVTLASANKGIKRMKCS